MLGIPVDVIEEGNCSKYLLTAPSGVMPPVSLSRFRSLQRSGSAPSSGAGEEPVKKLVTAGNRLRRSQDTVAAIPAADSCRPSKLVVTEEPGSSSRCGYG
ncbi:MAG: hypothetical protein MZV63_27990 [Marinilabiliales bacterium]|nr:hypothetical protein [Marinilabiliales bacterium]